MPHLLEVQGLTTVFAGDYGKNISVDHIDFHVDKGEVVCIVGESGCGKSVTSLSIMGLLRKDGAVMNGSVLFEVREMCNKAVKALLKRASGRHYVPGSRLQLFAGDGSGGSGDDGGDPGDGDDGGSGDDPDGDDEGRLSFDDFLGQEGNQSEFDKRVQAAVDAAVIRAREEWESAADDRVSEAEKLAKMTKEEREKYLQQKERREFEAERAAFEREKLLVEVRKELQEQTLPLVFADSLVTISDAKKIKEAISEIKKAWDAGITEAVKAKARQTTPPEGGQFLGSRRGLSSIRKMANENRIIKN